MAPNHNHNNGFTCPVCGTEQKKSQWMHGDLVRPVVIDLIHQDHPDWDPRQGICWAVSTMPAPISFKKRWRMKKAS